MRVQVFGASGMLGNDIFSCLARNPSLEVQGVSRRATHILQVPAAGETQMRVTRIASLDIANVEQVTELVARFGPDVIVNCVGWRQLPRTPADMAAMIDANSRWPHQLASVASKRGARLIHFSSDAVFSGMVGNYSETDRPDPVDAYGRSKLLGEPEAAGCLVLRTSMIGHEVPAGQQLVDWFLRQNGEVKGFARAVFSGLPTIEIANVVATLLLSRRDMAGIWHLAAEPISKLALLTEIAKCYGVPATLVPVEDPVIDRSLDASRFRAATGYRVRSWPELIAQMHAARPNTTGEA